MINLNGANDVGLEILTANRIYYVRTDGNDINNGLTNSSAGAFLTIQKAIDIVKQICLNGYTVTIQLADGTYNLSNNIQLPALLNGTASIVGNTTTPANVVINGIANWTGAEGLLNIAGGSWTLSGFKIQASGFGSGSGLICSQPNTKVFIDNLDSGSTNATHLWALYGGYIQAVSNYAISGGAFRHYWANANGYIRCQGFTLSITNTPAFSSQFCAADFQGIVVANGCTFSGSATGQRYLADTGGQIVAIGGANYFPGNSAGTTTGLGVGFYY